jgi:hypothetical protein
MTAVVERITRAYDYEQANPRPAVLRTDIPGSWEAITESWLTDVICAGVPHAAVTAFEFGPRDDGTSNRRRIFLQYNANGHNRRLPASVFCKASMGLENRIALGAIGCSHAETTFYSHARPLLAIEAPSAFLAAYDPESFAAIAVLNDLGADVEFCDEETPYTRSRAEGQVDLLAALHARFHGDPSLGAGALAFSHWTDWFANLERVMSMQTHCEKGFLEARHVVPPQLYRRAGEIWEATRRSVDRHRTLAPTLLHSDAHAKNWYHVRATGRMGLGDWQACCIGHWSRDYAYAVASSLRVEDRRTWEGDLLRRYLDRLAFHGVADVPSLDDAWLCYRQQLFTGLAFWTITLTPAPQMPDMQPRRTTLEMIKRLSHAIDDLDALDSFD